MGKDDLSKLNAMYVETVDKLRTESYSGHPSQVAVAIAMFNAWPEIMKALLAKAA